MKLHILAVVPELLESFLKHSIPGRAVAQGKVELKIIALRNHGTGNYKSIDDYPYGGGGGMVLACGPLSECLDELMEETNYDEIIYLSPDGEQLQQKEVNRLSTQQNILLVCGHYKGIDQRIRDSYITKEISIGDYVLSGGELAAAVLADAIIRILPGAIGDEMSALSDSHQDALLAPPVYTRPEVWRGKEVPSILLSGNDKAIAEWRLEQSIERTKKLRPDLLKPEEE